MDYGLVEYVGKFHPLLVHLPIGMLAIGILFGFLSGRDNYTHLKGANHIIFFLAALAATLSCLTGWLLSESGGYGAAVVGWHQWMGISLAVVAWLLFFVHSGNKGLFNGLLVAAAILLTVTGHLGGTITHGEGYLTPPPLADWFSRSGGGVEPVAIGPETLAYDAVANIVDRKCKSCHGPRTQKAGLRLDRPEHIVAGGEHGGVVVAGAPGQSELIGRVLLPMDDDDHMPPREKSQLSAAEIALLVEWVRTGANFEKTVVELNWADSVVYDYNQMVVSATATEDYDYIPEDEVEPADATVLQALDTLGVIILPVGENTNYLGVSFRLVPPDQLGQALQALTQIAAQCIWLDLTGKTLDGNRLATVGKMVNLTKLTLRGCSVDDSQLAPLGNLHRLEYLNLVGNPVSAKGLAALQQLTALNSLFLYQTEVTAADSAVLHDLFPQAAIDFGGYEVPVLHSDTAKIVY